MYRRDQAGVGRLLNYGLRVSVTGRPDDRELLDLVSDLRVELGADQVGRMLHVCSHRGATSQIVAHWATWHARQSAITYITLMVPGCRFKTFYSGGYNMRDSAAEFSTTYTRTRVRRNGGLVYTVDPARFPEFRHLVVGCVPVFELTRNSLTVYLNPRRKQELEQYLLLAGWVEHGSLKRSYQALSA